MEAKLKVFYYVVNGDKYLVRSMFGRDDAWVQVGQQTLTPEEFVSFQTKLVRVQGSLEITFHDGDEHKVLYTKYK